MDGFPHDHPKSGSFNTSLKMHVLIQYLHSRNLLDLWLDNMLDQADRGQRPNQSFESKLSVVAHNMRRSDRPFDYSINSGLSRNVMTDWHSINREWQAIQRKLRDMTEHEQRRLRSML